MTFLTAIMMTITLTVTVVMVPRLYLSWRKADSLDEAEGTTKLRELLEEENRWVKRHFGCGMAGLALVCLMMHYPSPQIPTSLTDCVALYVTISLIFAIVESILAQKIEDRFSAGRVPVKVRPRK